MKSLKDDSIESPLRWAQILKALADESRLLIIHELLKHEASVTELSETLGMKVYNISRHLRILETNGLVKKIKRGNSRIYSITESITNRFSKEDQILDLGCCKFTFKDLK
jgi:DNA-binding transcriptional ArsR family regulator